MPLDFAGLVALFVLLQPFFKRNGEIFILGDEIESLFLLASDITNISKRNGTSNLTLLANFISWNTEERVGGDTQQGRLHFLVLAGFHFGKHPQLIVTLR